MYLKQCCASSRIKIMHYIGGLLAQSFVAVVGQGCLHGLELQANRTHVILYVIPIIMFFKTFTVIMLV